MLWLLFIALAACGAEPRYELAGRIVPEARAAVYLYGATTPFSAAAQSDAQGHFRFKKLAPGAYTVAVFVPGRGEARQTVEVGPGTADARRRTSVTLQLRDSQFVYSEVERRHKVSARQLSIPDSAMREYEEAQKELAKPDVAAATAHLQRAVEIAPQFAMAWNHLGTIAYQTRDFARAEECFRRALKEDPAAYEPLVNLGGVLVTLMKLDEALEYNVYAVIARPNDALANSQLGMAYFYAGRLDLARKHLAKAREIDPAHFSHPQLLLAEIDMREKKFSAAAGELENFLRYHPDWPQREKMRAAIEKLRDGAPGITRPADR